MATGENVGRLGPTSNLSTATVLSPGGGTARTLAARAGDVVNVKDWGAVGDGVTDDSSAVVAAAAAASAICFPRGTYILNTVAITGATDLHLADGATLKHKTGSTTHMIVFTGTRLRIRGGAIDGNRTGQGSNRRYAVSADIPAGASVDVSDVEFTGTNAAAVAALNFGGELNVQRCRFADMSEHDGVSQHFTCAVYIGSGEVGARGRCRFNHNTLIGTIAPSLAGGSPGGIFFAPTTDYVAGEGNFSTLEAIGNYCYGIGQNCAGNDIAGIHTYPATEGLRAIGNYFEGCGFSAIAAKSAQNTIIQGNVIVNGVTSAQNDAASGAIYYTPGDHSGATVRPRAVISGNIVDTPGGEPGVKQNGISVIGTSVPSYADDVIISDNVISGAGVGIFVDYATDLRISGNSISGSSGGGANAEHGIHLNHCDGAVKISDNHLRVPNGYGIYGVTGLSTATVLAESNYVEHSAAASYAIILRGIFLLRVAGNTVSSSSGAFSIASAAAPVTTLVWDANRVAAGTISIDFANISSALGHLQYANAPEGLVAAPVGTLYTRTSAGNPTLYVKATSSTNQGWRPFAVTYVATDNGDVDKTLTATTHAPVQRWATTLTANRTVTLSASGATRGDTFRIVRTGLGAYTLDVGGLKTVPASTAAFVDVMFDGTAWFLTGYGAL